MKRFLIFVLACLLAACAGLDTRTQQIAAGCATASAALRALTIANDEGKLSTEQQGQILSAAGFITPICAATTPPTLDSVKLEAFNRAILLLQQQAIGLGETP